MPPRLEFLFFLALSIMLLVVWVVIWLKHGV
jgi:hypothetical protein